MVATAAAVPAEVGAVVAAVAAAVVAVRLHSQLRPHRRRRHQNTIEIHRSREVFHHHPLIRRRYRHRGKHHRSIAVPVAAVAVGVAAHLLG